MSKCKKVIVGILTVTLLFSIALTGCSKSSSTDSNSKSKNTGTAIDYPTKPVNMIIAFSAGGSSDVQARIMQKYWNKYVPKQPWVFNYKAGAGGAVGFAEIAHAKADGYTIGGVNVPHIVLQPLGQGAQYSVDDFAYLCQAVQDPQVLAVNKDSKFNTWQEVIDYAKANPEKLKCGLVGTYTGTHLMLLELEDLTGAKMTQVVYKGASDQNAALMGGELDLIIGNVNDVMRSLDMIKVLAVSSEKRSDFLPDVPTFKETGLNLVTEIRRGFVAPKDTDPEIVAYLRDIFKKINEDPDYIADMKKAGQPVAYLDGDDFEKYVHEQDAHAKEILEKYDLIKK